MDIVQFLADLPDWWAVILLLLMCTPYGVIALVGWFFDRRWRCYAFSANVGDPLLCVAMLIGRQVVLDGNIGGSPECLEWASAAVAIIIMVTMMTIRLKTKTPFDGGAWYHDVVTTPLVTYLMLCSFVVVFSGDGKTEFGTTEQKNVFVSCFVLWAGLVWYDLRSGRWNQPKWMLEHFWN